MGTRHPKVIRHAVIINERFDPLADLIVVCRVGVSVHGPHDLEILLPAQPIIEGVHHGCGGQFDRPSLEVVEQPSQLCRGGTLVVCKTLDELFKPVALHQRQQLDPCLIDGNRQRVCADIQRPPSLDERQFPQQIGQHRPRRLCAILADGSRLKQVADELHAGLVLVSRFSQVRIALNSLIGGNITGGSGQIGDRRDARVDHRPHQFLGLFGDQSFDTQFSRFTQRFQRLRTGGVIGQNTLNGELGQMRFACRIGHPHPKIGRRLSRPASRANLCPRLADGAR